MKLITSVLLLVATCQGQELEQYTPVLELEQYTPDKADWSTFYSKAVLDHEKNTDHSPDGIFWIDRDDWKEWDGTIYDPTLYSKKELAALICPGNTVRGIYELFEAESPFEDNVNPTKAEVDNWHAIAVNHVRAMVGYTGDEYTIKPDKCLHLRALWCDEKKYTTKWDTDAYPERCAESTNPHCGAGFIPSVQDQQEYLPDDINSCGKKAGSEGLFNSAKSNIPWSIKWIRPFCYTLGAEGFWGGHTGPWFHRSEFGWSWRDPDPDNFNSNAGLRTKWSGPSGDSKYINPDITDGKFTVNVEDVNPNPRFSGMECEGRKWSGGALNATDCYFRMMEDETCGKRFMTFNSGNFGCACYPTDMAACKIDSVAQRLTWDFEPIVSSFDGLFIDTSKSLSNNNLPYSGRVCPQIKWKGGAGDASHCLQKIMENTDGSYSDCGRNFVTFNAGGGCACYPPDQETCTKSETVKQSGRQTYELEVDPAYNAPTTSSPSTSPIPSAIPSTVPSGSPIITSPIPSTVPSGSPIITSPIPSAIPSTVPSGSPIISPPVKIWIKKLKLTYKKKKRNRFQATFVFTIKAKNEKVSGVPISLDFVSSSGSEGNSNGNTKDNSKVTIKSPNYDVGEVVNVTMRPLEKGGYIYKEKKNHKFADDCPVFSSGCSSVEIMQDETV